nr:hypothetical protein GCM10020092_024160 [Actinoplanes digitatis]
MKRLNVWIPVPFASPTEENRMYPSLPPPARKLVALAAAVVTALATVGAPASAALVTTPVTVDGAHWIWYPEGAPAQSAPAATRYLRRTFTAPARPVRRRPARRHRRRHRRRLAQRHLPGRLAPRRRLVEAGPLRRPGRGAAVRQQHPPDRRAQHQRRPRRRPRPGTRRRRRGTVDLVTDGSWQAANSVPEAWVAAADLGAYGAGPWAQSVAAADNAAASPVTPAGLTTERRTDPVGVDPRRPRFGWRLDATANGQVQGRYQVTVGSTVGGADVWDSGQVASAASVDVAYGGPALASNRTYHWRVRVWDAQG